MLINRRELLKKTALGTASLALTPSFPSEEFRRSRLNARDIQQSGFGNQRQHQQLVDVEQEANGGDEADQPLGAGEF